jgi:cholesterol oxidase
MYAPLYEHDQLNEATHNALREMFGIANMSSFDHLGQMVRRGQLVAADGADVYLLHLERLAIPIAFIHGKENACFLCIFGKNASRDVYPLIVKHLEGRGG